MARPVVTPSPAIARWAAALLPVSTAAGLSLVRESVTTSTSAVVLVLTVVACAATGDRVAGVLGAVCAALAFDVFLTAPYGSLAIADRDDVEVAVALVAVGLAVTGVAQWGHRQAADAERRRGYIAGLSQLLDLPDDQSASARGAVIASGITEVLGADHTAWVGYPPRSDDAVVTRAGTVRIGASTVDVARDGLPTGSCTAFPVERDGHVLGHFSVVSATRTVRPSTEQLRVALLLADRMSTTTRTSGTTQRE